jgi:hypothetical protein
LLGEGNGKNPEPTLETGVHEERTGGGVHSADVHGVLDVLEGKLGAIKPMLVVFVLTEERNGRLSVVLVEHGHVEIINELEHLVLAEGGVGATSLLLKLGLELLLEESRVGVEVKVDNLLEVVISSRGHFVEETLNNLGLTATGISNEERRVVDRDVFLHKELGGNSVRSGHSERADTLGGVNLTGNVLSVELGPLF